MKLLLLKLLIAPLFVAMASLAGRRWGLKVSGWLSGFPIVAGPILFFFALEQGDAFAAEAAQKTLLGLMAFGAFVLVYAWASTRFHVVPSILAGWVAFLLMDSVVLHLETTLLPSLGLAIVGLSLVGRLLPTVKEPVPPSAAGHSMFDIPMRMAATALLVVFLTGMAGVLGPHWSGLLTPFPVATAVLAGFAQLRGGPSAAAQLLSGSLMGMFGFSSFCAVLSYGLVPWGRGFGFGAAVLTVLVVQGMVMILFNRRANAA